MLKDGDTVLKDDDTVLTEGDEGSAEEGVNALVRRAEAAGMPVVLHGEEVRVPISVRTTVRRVVREGLTNAAKHAPGAPVTVRLTDHPGETVVTVANASSRRPGGYGLRGLTERVRLQGGTLHAGPTGGGFTLTVRLPHTATPGASPLVSGPSGDGPTGDGPTGRVENDIPPGGRTSDPYGSADRDGVPPDYASRPVGPDLEQARRRVRRARLAAVLVSLAAAAGVTAFVLGFTVYDAATSVLPPAEFARLRPGQAEAEVAAVLPARTRIDDPSWPEPPIPAGARCRYYSTHSDPFGDRGLELYRLCFAGGRLVSRDFLPV